MKTTELLFDGDQNHNVRTTGDCCVGDDVKFSRATFVGSWKKPRFNGYEVVEGEIIKESYGADKAQHTFTIKLISGVNLQIKGRNLYKNGTFRKAWPCENARLEVLEEKHGRGAAARELKEYRV